MKEFIKISEKIFKSIPYLDAEIRTIENGQYEEDKNIYWIVEASLCESLGELGYIYTFFYDEKPTEDEIIKDIKEHIKEQIKDLNDDYFKSAIEEKQLKCLKKIKFFYN